jgi:hypothetical protein
MNEIKALKIISEINEEVKNKEEYYTKKVHNRIVDSLKKTQRIEVSNYYGKFFLKVDIAQIITVYLNALAACCLKTKANQKGRITLDNGKVRRISKFRGYSFQDIKSPTFENDCIQFPKHWLDWAEKFDNRNEEDYKKSGMQMFPTKGQYHIDLAYVQHLVVNNIARKTYDEMVFALENIDRVNQFSRRREKLLKIKSEITRHMLADYSISNAVEDFGDKYLPHLDDLSCWDENKKNTTCMKWLLEQEDPHGIVVEAIKKHAKHNAHHVFNMNEETICIEEWKENSIVFYVDSHSFCNETDSHYGETLIREPLV